jgi:hypothetical protein
MTPVVVKKLTTCDAFVVTDLDGAPAHAGIVRLAPKILVDGATTLARSLTYLYASFGQQVGGASAGINAKPDDRDAAVGAFADELGPEVAAGAIRIQAGKGVTDADLAPLTALVPEPSLDPGAARDLLGTGVVSALTAARGPLAGARVAIDGLEVAPASLLAALAGEGAVVVAVSSSTGSVADAGGIDLEQLGPAFIEHGAAVVTHLGRDVDASGAVFATEADVLLTGSKVGAIDHDVAATVTAGLVVPIAPVPVTAKGLAVLRRSGTTVLPDFITAAGPWFATFPGAPTTVEELRVAVAEHVAAALSEVLQHDDGPLLAACYRAEAHLRTWRESLPFGRPLA